MEKYNLSRVLETQRQNIHINQLVPDAILLLLRYFSRKQSSTLIIISFLTELANFSLESVL